MSCVRASSPVAAVMFGGVLRVNIGSTITLSGIMERWRRLTFTLASGIAITAFRVTSAPVPAVVGMAIIGAGGWSSGFPSPRISR